MVGSSFFSVQISEYILHSFFTSIFVLLRYLLYICKQNDSNMALSIQKLDVAYSEPNEVTKAAIEEAKSGRLRNVAPIDTSSVEAMFKSAGL